MGNLLNEYRNRHKLNFIWGSNDGVCFFSKNRKPAAICLLTDASRTYSTCSVCSSMQSKFVCELLGLSNHIVGEEIFEVLLHQHVNVDVDVNKLVSDIAGDYTPYVAKNQQDLEAWLWNLFLKTNFLHGNKFDDFVKKQDRKMHPAMKAVEQMAWTVGHYANIYSIYYERFYVPFMIARNYLLYR